jgi:hypothetical protein
MLGRDTDDLRELQTNDCDSDKYLVVLFLSNYALNILEKEYGKIPGVKCRLELNDSNL